MNTSSADRLSELADDLMSANGGEWGEHPDHPVATWRAEVASEDVRSGYWEWVASRVTAASDAEYALRLRARAEAAV